MTCVPLATPVTPQAPHAMLSHLGTHATWYHIPHFCELVCVLTLAYDSNPFDCKALLPQTLSLETTSTAYYPTLGLKKQSSPLGNLALAPTVITSHSCLAPWTSLATTGPNELCQLPQTLSATLIILDHPSCWTSSSSNLTLHPYGPTKSCHPPWQPCFSGLRCLSYYLYHPSTPLQMLPDSSSQLSSSLQGSATTYSSAYMQGCFAGLFAMVEVPQ
jgi:hypothetical protein